MIYWQVTEETDHSRAEHMRRYEASDCADARLSLRRAGVILRRGYREPFPCVSRYSYELERAARRVIFDGCVE